MTRRTRASLVALALSLALPGAAALATEHRSSADCATLPGTERDGERAACLHCVGRRVKHHYNDELAPGHRCHEDGEVAAAKPPEKKKDKKPTPIGGPSPMPKPF